MNVFTSVQQNLKSDKECMQEAFSVSCLRVTTTQRTTREEQR